MAANPGTPPHLLLFGPPGSGKSTQSALLARRLPISAISTGNLLREEVAAGSALGRQVREVLARHDVTWG